MNMDNVEKLISLIGEANYELDCALSAIKGLDGFDESVIKGCLGTAASKIERSFNLINGENAPCAITPEDVMRMGCANNNHNSEVSDCYRALGISANPSAVSTIKDTVSFSCWKGIIRGAKERLNGKMSGFKYADEYYKNNELIELEPSLADSFLFFECQTDYQPHKEQELYEKGIDFIKTIQELSEHYIDIVDTAVLTVRNSIARGNGHKPNATKLNRLTHNVMASIRILADKALFYGLRSLAKRLLKKFDVADLIVEMMERNDYSATEEQKKKIFDAL